jgi:hypothetical protein
MEGYSNAPAKEKGEWMASHPELAAMYGKVTMMRRKKAVQDANN